jgi:hypothetical protein
MDPLEGVRVASPCEVAWDRMAGDERVRHCTQCDLNVYNFAELTRDEIRDLLARTEGRVCARLYRRADGTLLTRDCPSGLRRLQRRMSRAAAAMVAAMVSASAFLTGCATSRAPRVQNQGVQLTVVPAVTPQPAVLSGRVCDVAGNPMPGVAVVLRGEAGQCGPTTAVTDENGAFSITSPDDGSYVIEVTSNDFTPVIIEHLVLKQNAVTRAQVQDWTSVTMGIVVSQESETPAIDILSTTYPQEFINKLPL